MSKKKRIKSAFQGAPHKPLMAAGRLSFIKTPLFQAGFTMLAAISVYINTLSAPFGYDDTYQILNNTAIRDIGNLGGMSHQAFSRFLGFFSFALNYAVHQYDVTGYHVVNIAVHAAASVFILLFAKKMCEALGLSEKARLYLPFLSALVFAAHPLNTQAVTYIVQRMTSMAAMFFFGAMFFYMCARMPGKTGRRVLFAALAALFAVAAFFSKQNAYVFPIVVFLMEWLLFQTRGKKLLIGLAASVLLLFGMWCVVALIYNINPFSLQQLLDLTRESHDITRLDYFMTQTKAVWIYIKLFFWPAGLRVDYDMALSRNFFSPGVFAALLGHVLVLACAFALKKRHPAASFSIFFYYTAHLVESSFLPITDLVNEHRAYMPDMGLSILAGYAFAGMHDALGKKVSRKELFAITAVLSALLLSSLSAATVMRNALWNHPAKLWIDNAEKSPQSYRANNEAGRYLNDEGRYNEAMPYLKKAMVLSSPESEGNMLRPKLPSVINYIVSLTGLGRYDEAERTAKSVLAGKMAPFYRARVLERMGDIRLRQNRNYEAEKYFRDALKYFSGNIATWTYLGIALEKQNKIVDAEEIYRKILEMDPKNHEANMFFSR